MSRKDYIAIAAILANELQHADKSARLALIATAHRLADLFNADNARFDRARFLNAAGVN